jgi:hypothetical protein
MRKNIGVLASLFAVAALVNAACGSGGTGGTTGSGGATSSSTSDASTTSATSTGAGGGASCVKAGDMGNAQGVGAFCTPGGMECAKFPLAGLCLADVGQTPPMCTRISCKSDADCGDAAHCHCQDGQSGCVPDKCEPASMGGCGTSTATATGAGGGTSTGTGAGGAGGK